ncbi:hypothetical protein THAOC_20055 [Thalassiosira oceanica]|uniref:Uncharacterized protein n=1 Tax=Thalassiosira oceanica TaxID=159749 RepID=K0SFM5_THAOC|nr:hypothetical protein THAOC_20055 [Thalassiosira oceanica]|eukprot:EJK59686.1 hypothetical protein THAOC_20055 [Thalassiosira oceanica]
MDLPPSCPGGPLRVLSPLPDALVWQWFERSNSSKGHCSRAVYRTQQLYSFSLEAGQVELNAREVKRFEVEYGEDWDGTMIEYDSDFVDLPKYVAVAFGWGNLRAVLQWLSKGNLKERVTAKWEEGGNLGLLYIYCSYEQTSRPYELSAAQWGRHEYPYDRR